MVIARGGGNREFERVEPDVFLDCEIVEVKDRINENKKYFDKVMEEWTTKPTQEVRFGFKVEGYQFKHYSRWLTLSVGKMSNLYNKLLKKLVTDLNPDTDVDLDKFIGKKVKVMWTDEEKDGVVYQNILNIKPISAITVLDVSENKDKITPMQDEPKSREANASEDLPF